jgi:hypothetical protein
MAFLQTKSLPIGPIIYEVVTVVKMSMLVFFSPEDGGCKFLRNVGIYLQVYNASQLRGPTSKPILLHNMMSSRLFFYRYNFGIPVYDIFPLSLFISMSAAYVPMQYVAAHQSLVKQIAGPSWG